MPINILLITGRENNTAQPLADNCHSSMSQFSPFKCCLSVVLYLDKGDYPENLHVVSCPSKQCSFEHFKGSEYLELKNREPLAGLDSQNRGPLVPRSTVPRCCLPCVQNVTQGTISSHIHSTEVLPAICTNCNTENL